jgi:hypothetical protein
MSALLPQLRRDREPQMNGSVIQHSAAVPIYGALVEPPTSTLT